MDSRSFPKSTCVWILATTALMFLAAAEVQRVASGDLFLLQTDFDPPPSMLELRDAESSGGWKYPAVGAVCCCCCLLFALTRKTVPHVRPPVFLMAVFLVATAFDLWSTLRFFHVDGIDTEVHPGVRVLSYAYGRTAGPVIAKTVQAAGVLFLASRLPRFASFLLIATSMLYAAAALRNIGLI